MAFICIILSLQSINPFLRPENTLVFYQVRFLKDNEFSQLAKSPLKDITDLVHQCKKDVLISFEYSPLLKIETSLANQKTVPDWKAADIDRSIPTRVYEHLLFVFPLH
jgi:hypothetical protein